jgi:nitrite reductase/ring-hydroxylating ferredoxin subunit
MTASTEAKTAPVPHFVRAADLARLRARGRLAVRVGGQQIALSLAGERVLACSNRCPHEGYPLVEGTLSQDCVLTCNWHGWRFDLRSGQNLTGGDRLRSHPVEIRAGEVWVDVSAPEPAARIGSALVALREALLRQDYTRIAREIARLEGAGADPLEAVREALRWAHDLLEFGATHAQAAAADWLRLREQDAPDGPSRLTALLEIAGHFAEDGQGERRHAYSLGRADYRADRLLEAIEAQDEAGAVAQIRGALDSGVGFTELEPALCTAALAHYQDFGHSANSADHFQTWRVAEPGAWLARRRQQLFDHGAREYIISCHLVKTAMAVSDEVAHAPSAPWVPALLAATHRCLDSAVHRKHALRTARQALDFAVLEGAWPRSSRDLTQPLLGAHAAGASCPAQRPPAAARAWYAPSA